MIPRWANVAQRQRAPSGCGLFSTLARALLTGEQAQSIALLAIGASWLSYSLVRPTTCLHAHRRKLVCRRCGSLRRSASRGSQGQIMRRGKSSKQVLWTVVGVLLLGICTAAQWEISESDTPRGPRWVRTSSGWERTAWLRKHAYYYPSVHPLVVAMLIGLTTTAALAAFPPRGGASTFRVVPASHLESSNGRHRRNTAKHAHRPG
jgi:hypothetical protein